MSATTFDSTAIDEVEVIVPDVVREVEAGSGGVCDQVVGLPESE